MPDHSSTHRIGRATARAGLISLLTVMLASGTTLAAKGGGAASSASTLTGPVMVLDANGNGLPNHGDEITFTVSTSAPQPQVGLRCWQGANWVYDGYVGYFPGYMFTPYFTLDSGYWNPALSANCTARLFYNDKRGRQHVLATLGFDVAP